MILQIRDEEWGGMFVDLISQDVPYKSVVKVVYNTDNDSSKQVR